MVADRARAALLRLDAYMTEHDLAGPDPYDGLSGWLGSRPLPARVRQGAAQAVKRSRVNLRPVLGVRPARMTKTLALVAEGLRRASWLPDATRRRRELLDEIVDRRSEAWGYEFDVQTRWAFYPAGSPNIIVTAFAIEALRASAEHLEDVRFGVRDWLLREMSHEGYFRYVPGSTTLIHNANLFGARALHRVEPGHPAVATAVRRTLDLQRPDGTWPYGEGPRLGWIDGFHTAYILLALDDLREVCQVAGPLDRGVRAYVERLFSPAGEPLYYADRAGPVDVHNAATGLLALAALRGHLPEGNDLLERTFGHTLRMQGRDGAFRSSTRAPAYMRWNQAHAYRALCEVVR